MLLFSSARACDFVLRIASFFKKMFWRRFSNGACFAERNPLNRCQAQHVLSCQQRHRGPAGFAAPDRGVEPGAPALWLPAHHGVAAACGCALQCQVRGAHSPPGRTPGAQGPGAHEASGSEHLRTSARHRPQRRVELGLRGRSNRERQPFSHPHAAGRAYPR